MARLSTAVQKRHEAVQARLEDSTPLTMEEIHTVLDNYHEGANHLNGLHGAFFTPRGLARDFALEVQGHTVIDLCAGIGTLSYACTLHDPNISVTCVEQNPDYVKVGKRILPNATWICGDVSNIQLSNESRFDVAISNPPFGNINGIGMFDLEVVRLASFMAKRGVFILPQLSTPFRYSGHQNYGMEITDKLQRWIDKTGIQFNFNCGIDCNTYLNEWKGIKPVVEIVNCEFIS